LYDDLKLKKADFVPIYMKKLDAEKVDKKII